ncbi:O-antigen/teichoic acid export membrane protein [Roseivirga pacifica]|uniref:Membrane protein involved in the export of O-antigen and teichoic acid n=1 Tax=Roseivirga pacifica TaxID=1267423 RepID=A0A1I0N6B5_9BACT|nr:oligosaccharide flippase family protein [Roseivirga pacifica]RKQ50957.1 O-antigen/teichoic acid export membrane protein [Roseivirga pacifica]SEV96629.1 Membrane protein involved in the export of O-antigen and teichoic acid [Roseivirga pacifica]
MKTKDLFVVYGVSSITGALPFIFAPVVSDILEVEEFGFYNLLHSSVYFLMPILTLGYQTAIRSKISQSPFLFRKTIRTWGGLILFQSVVVSLIYAIARLLNLVELETVNFLVVVSAAIPIAVMSFLRIYWELLERFISISIIKFVSTLSVYLLVLLFLEFQGGYYSRIIPQILVYTAVCGVLLLLIFKEGGQTEGKPPKHKELLGIGWPLTLVSFLDLFVLNMDKWLVLTFRGDYELGLYTAYFYFYTGLVFLATPLGSIIETYIFKNKKEASHLRLLLYGIVFVLVTISLVLNSQLVDLLFGEDYMQHSFLVAVFAFAGFFRVLISDRIRDLVHIRGQKQSATVYLICTVIFGVIIYLAAKLGNYIHIAFAILGFNLIIFLFLTLLYRNLKLKLNENLSRP